MFKKGDKVRNKVTGDVLTYGYTESNGETIYVSSISEKMVSGTHPAPMPIAWKVEDCELCIENKKVLAHPKEGRFPKKEDADDWGRVLAKRKGESRSDFFPWEKIGSAFEAFEWWMHTPDFAPRKPLLDKCEGCNFNVEAPMCDLKGDPIWYCTKHDTWCEEPFYAMYNTPCHLED